MRAIDISLQTIGNRSRRFARFKYGLTAITIPDSVTAIGANPFYHCNSLTQITVSPDHSVLETIGGVLFNKPDKLLVTYPCAFTDSEYVIPQDITIQYCIDHDLPYTYTDAND